MKNRKVLLTTCLFFCCSRLFAQNPNNDNDLRSAIEAGRRLYYNGYAENNLDSIQAAEAFVEKYVDYLLNDFAKYLISKFCDIDAADENGNSPLFYSTGKNMDMTKLLLENGADKDLRNNDGKTPLHKAVTDCEYDYVKLFVNEGANINIPDNSFHTPIYYAKIKNYEDIYKFLLENGAKKPD